jgi:hypothetical protein
VGKKGKMKKEIIAYFTKWLHYYQINDEGIKRVMGKVEELFKTYDDVVQNKVTGEWKTERRISKKD